MGTLATLLFQQQSMAPHAKSPGDGQGASSASRGSHGEGRLPNCDHQAGGGVLGSPLLELRETSLFGKQPGGRWPGCSAELSGGVSFLWLVLDADTHVGEEPLLRLAPVVFMP